MKDGPREPLSTSAMFFAYEVVSAIGFLAFFTPYALIRMIRTPSYRAGLRQRLALQLSDLDANNPDPIWIQAVSLGEVKSVAPLIRKINDTSARPVLLTSTTQTGHSMAEELLGRDNIVTYFPLDFSPIVKRMISHAKPRAIVLFETEIWPNFIRTASSSGIPVSIINGRISEKSFRYYRLMSGLFRGVLSRVHFAGMQTHRDAERAIALGVAAEAVKVCGNMKFDSAPSHPSSERIEQLRRELGLGRDAVLLVGGSTHDGEEVAMLEAYRAALSHSANVRLLLAPRHPERFGSVASLIRASGFKVYRRSEANHPAQLDSDVVILLDTIGELAHVYALASAAFVGGSLARIGGHNIVEPAAMGKPVIFGPHMHHFQDIKEMFLSERAAICVADGDGLRNSVVDLLRNPERAASLASAAERVVEANRGATDRYFDALREYL